MRSTAPDRFLTHANSKSGSGCEPSLQGSSFAQELWAAQENPMSGFHPYERFAFNDEKSTEIEQENHPVDR